VLPRKATGERSDAIDNEQQTPRGNVRFTVDAFSTDDSFDPRRAEAPSSIPGWVWVLPLFVPAWAVWYAARMWDVPAEFAQTPN
jgi:hypothetical protein